MTEASVDLNLDELAAAPLRVTLGGKTWSLSGGPQSQVVVDIASLFDQFEKRLRDGDSDGVKAVSDEIRAQFFDLFNECPQEESCYTIGEDGERELDLPDLNDEQLAALFQLLVSQITGANVGEDGEAEGDPPTQPTTAKRKSAPRSRAKSRKAPSRAPSGS